MKGILLAQDGDISAVNGTIHIGDTFTQEVELLLALNQGEVKTDPLLGPSLVRKMRSNFSGLSLQTEIKKHLKRDNKDIEQLENYLQIISK